MNNEIQSGCSLTRRSMLARSGMGLGALALRLTDVHGQVVKGLLA